MKNLQGKGFSGMDLTGYIMDLESLISKYTISISVEIALLVLAIFSIWLVPYLEKRTKKKPDKHKTKRKIRLEKVAKRNLLIFQVVFSVFLVVVGGLFIKGDVKTRNALKADESHNAVAIFEGEAYLHHDYHIIGGFPALFDLISIDSRLVTFEGSDESYYISMSEIDEGWLEDWGDFHGKITYGENSKFILKIE